MQNQQKLETLRESEHNLEKISFFCNAKKELYIFEKAEIINRCINETDYQKTLEGFTKTKEMLRIDFKFILGIHRLMLNDSLFFK